MKTKLLIQTDETTSLWWREDAFEVELPFMPQIGMILNFKESTIKAWQDKLYKSYWLYEYVYHYGYYGLDKSRYNTDKKPSCSKTYMSNQKARKLFTNGFKNQKKPYFNVEEADQVAALEYDQYDNVLYVIMDKQAWLKK